MGSAVAECPAVAGRPARGKNFHDKLFHMRENGLIKISTEKISDSDILEINRLRGIIKNINGMEHERLELDLFTIINRITRGKFLDKRNVNHAINASRVEKQDFNIHDEFDINRLHFGPDEYRFFFYSIHGNPYASFFDVNKIIIFSAENKKLKLLLRFYLKTLSDRQRRNMSTNGVYGKQISKIIKFLKGHEQDLSDTVTPYDFGYLMLELTKTTKVKWSDIADCIVDLEKGQVYFFDTKK